MSLFVLITIFLQKSELTRTTFLCCASLTLKVKMEVALTGVFSKMV